MRSLSGFNSIREEEEEEETMVIGEQQPLPDVTDTTDDELPGTTILQSTLRMPSASSNDSSSEAPVDAPLQLADPIVAGSATANLFANIARETRARSASSPSKHTATLLSEADDIADEDEGANDVNKVDESVMREQLQLWHSARQARAVEEAESGLGPRTVSLVAGRGRRMSSSFGGGVQRTRAMSMAPQGCSSNRPATTVAPLKAATPILTTPPAAAGRARAVTEGSAGTGTSKASSGKSRLGMALSSVFSSRSPRSRNASVSSSEPKPPAAPPPPPAAGSSSPLSTSSSIRQGKKGVAARIAKLEAFSSSSKLFGSAKSFDASERSTETEEDSARSAHDEPIPPPPPVETRPRAESLQQIIERRESLPPTPDVPPPLKTRGRAMSGQI